MITGGGRNRELNGSLVLNHIISNRMNLYRNTSRDLTCLHVNMSALSFSLTLSCLPLYSCLCKQVIKLLRGILYDFETLPVFLMLFEKWSTGTLFTHMAQYLDWQLQLDQSLSNQPIAYIAGQTSNLAPGTYVVTLEGVDDSY